MSTYSKIIIGLLGLSAAVATAILVITFVNDYEQTLVPFYVGGIIVSVTLAAARYLSDPSRRNKDRIVRKGGAPVIAQREDNTKYVPQD